MQSLFLLLRILFVVFSVTLGSLNIPLVEGKFHNSGSSSQEKQAQRFAMEPQDQTAIIGSRVTLPCRVIDKSGLIQWTKDDFGLGVHRNLSGFDRYSMVGSDEEGDFSLDISPIMLDDDARYQCQVSPGANGEYRNYSRRLIFLHGEIETRSNGKKKKCEENHWKIQGLIAGCLRINLDKKKIKFKVESQVFF